MNTFLPIGSFVIGLLGLIFGLMQYRDSRRIKRLMEDQYMVLFNRVKYRMPSKETIRKYISEHQLSGDSKLTDHLWTSYQGISDLYVSMVGFYLNNEKKFTYTDLEKMVKNKFVNSHWQEKVWRNLISNRPENRNTSVPDFYLPVGTLNDDYENGNGTANHH